MKKTIVDDNFEIELCVTSKSADYNAKTLLDKITDAIGDCIYNYISEAENKKLLEFIQSITTNKVTGGISFDILNPVSVYTNLGLFIIKLTRSGLYKVTDPNGKYEYYDRQRLAENLNNLLLKGKIENETENQSYD
jgi:hypothetical protein